MHNQKLVSNEQKGKHCKWIQSLKSEANLFTASAGSISDTSREPVYGNVEVGMHTATSRTLQLAASKAAPIMCRTLAFV